MSVTSRLSFKPEQVPVINCPVHSNHPVISICTLDTCGYGCFICPKCSLEKPEHIHAHKYYIELIEDFSQRMNSLSFQKDSDFSKWEQELEQKTLNVLGASEAYEKNFEDIINSQLSLLQEKLTKQTGGLYQNLKNLFTRIEKAALDGIKKRIDDLRTKILAEKAVSVLKKNRTSEALKSRKEIEDSMSLIQKEAMGLVNLSGKTVPVDDIVSAVMNQFSIVLTRLNWVVTGSKDNNWMEVLQEIKKQNARLEAEMGVLAQHKKMDHSGFSNYSSNSTQYIKSPEHTKEFVERSSSSQKKGGLSINTGGLRNKDGVEEDENVTKSEELTSLRSRKSPKRDKYLALFMACEKKTSNLTPWSLKATIKHEDMKNLIENYVKTNLKENFETYYGEHQNGKKEGFGVEVCNEFIYIGEYKEDVPNGKGKMIFKNSDFHEGYWVNGKLEGEGRSILQSPGLVYTGHFVHGLKEGYGAEEKSDGSQYKGYFKEGNKHGKGEYKWPNGEKYEGNFEKNKMTGKGTYTWEDGTVYVGEWLNNKLSGKGLMIEGSGGRYLGTFKEDKKEGYGVYTWNDGWIYRGHWKNGLQHGIGTEIDPKGTTRVCEWKEGKVVRVLA